MNQPTPVEGLPPFDQYKKNLTQQAPEPAAEEEDK